MERVLSATKARVRFGELMRQVTEDRQTVIVERGGVPQVVVLSVTKYKQLQKAASEKIWQSALERAARVGERIEARRQGRPLTHPAEVIREGREERDAHYPDLR